MDTTLVHIVFMTLTGLCFGSLNTLLIHRLPRNMPIGIARSHCPVCKHTLTICDLFPLFSWLLSRGKCRYCSTAVHWRYPLIECITAASFLIIYGLHGWSVTTLLLCLAASQIIVLCIIDMQHRIIPDGLQITLAANGIAYSLYHHVHIMQLIIVPLAAAAFGLLLQACIKWWKKQDGLGMGDVKFLAVVGTWLTPAAFIPFFFYSGILGIVSALLWRIISADPRFPFGPALALSMLILVVYPPSAQWFEMLSLQLVQLLRII